MGFARMKQHKVLIVFVVRRKKAGSPLLSSGKKSYYSINKEHKGMPKKIALAADHAGFEEKEKLKATLNEIGVEFDDMGTFSADSAVDYPDYARKVAEAVSRGEYEQGLLVCGSGTGMAISANKVKGVRAAVAWNEDIARLARQHNNANVLSLAARYTPDAEIKKIVKAWFEADFEGGRHERRVEKIGEIEKDDLN
jgi:ribose 5-phosphate isomerase B